MAEDKFIIKNGLVVENTSSGTTVLDIQGQNGQLFSVTDNLVGEIFAVSDISGIPILAVNSNGTVNVDGEFYVGTGKTSGYNTGDQDLSDLITNGAGHSMFVDVSGDTMIGALYVNNATASSNTATGAIHTAGGLGVVGATNIGGALTITGDVKTNSTTISNSVATGSGVFGGGLGVAGAGNFGGILKTTDSTSSSSTITGSLIAAGGAGISGALYVGGLGNFSGSLTSSNLTVNGSDYNMLTLKRSTANGSSILFSNSGSNLGKLGFDGGGQLIISTGNANDSTANLLLISSSGFITTSGPLRSNANNTYELGASSYRWSNVYTQLLNVSGASTFSSSITSGGIIRTTDTTISTSTITGSGIFSGGLGVGGAIYNNGTINSTGVIQTSNSTASNSTTTGSLIVSGGAGVGEDIYVAGQVAFGSASGKCQMIYNSTENSIDFIIN